ncbi:MAG TPA: EfeM/EfeO family lipoprotein [Trebonia sp.]|nr:EfeM/EfeO family lipoprotein [Trebonia sp.]
MTVACAVVAVGIGAGGALVATSAAPAAGGAVPVTVTASSCGASAGWHRSAGPVTFDVTSHAPGYTSVYLVAASGDVLAELPSLGQGRTQPLSTALTGGRYTLRCVLTDATVRVSGSLQVYGTARGAAAGYQPMPDLALTGAVRAYTSWVAGRLPGLLAACRRLDGDVARGDLAAARSDWLRAHLDYERLGAAYNAFGDFDPRIDEMAAGLPQTTATPGWTGFFAIEHALWGGQPASRARPLTRNLVSAVAGLIADFPSEEIDPGDLPLRTHEILENALEFQLTGAADYGSGTTLATAYANTQGTAEILGTLAPLLAPLAPAVLAAARHGLAALQGDLLAERAADGRWRPVAQLAATARERLDGAIGALLETLSQVPGILTPRDGA